MWWFPLLAFGQSSPEDCVAINMSDVLAVAPPAVIVLGERYATEPDLTRATRVAYALLRRAPVTVALEAVDHGKQSVLDAHAAGDLLTYQLRDELEWDAHWPWPYDPYEDLVALARKGGRVVAAGLPLQAPPAGATFPLPSGYQTILRDTTGGFDPPFKVEGQLVRMAAWRQSQIAEHALADWDRVGYLVIVTGRENVVGGKGVPWQASLLVKKPVEVHSFMLAWGGDPPCYTGDRYWRGLFE